MKKTKKILSALLAGILAFSFSGVSVNAEQAKIEMLDNTPTAFVSSFGRVNLNGKNFTAFKTLDTAINALPEEGGRIYFNGNANIESLKSNGKSLELIGSGTKSTGNAIVLKSQTLLLDAPLKASNLVISMPKDGYILSNGNSFTALSGFDSYPTERYINGESVKSYQNPISFAIGNSDNDCTSSLLSGYFSNVSVGYNNSTIKGNASLLASGIKADNFSVGSTASGFIAEGSVYVDISSAEIGTFSMGNGSIAGNLILNISSDTTIGKYNSNDTLKVSGKTVVISPAEIAELKADKKLVISNGAATAIIKDGVLNGLSFLDKSGFPTQKILLDGKELSSENGIFDIPDGTHTVSVLSTMEIRANPQANYVSGYSDGTFGPQNNMSRAEAMTLLARLIVDESKIKSQLSASYLDVDKNSWYSPYVGLFQTLGALKKLESNGNIYPDAKITRGEFCELISNIYTLVTGKLGGFGDFSDVSKNHKYYDAIGVCSFAKIVNGYEGGKFLPENNITRAEAVTMINRFIGRVPSEVASSSFSDVQGHWALSQINAAANPAVKEGQTMWTLKATDSYGKYMQYRVPLTNSLKLLEEQKKLNVAFIGGSITAGAGSSNAELYSYRARTVDYLKKAYPDCTINMVNAAIGDSFTKYAVYRLDNDLLKYDYDLVFVEYAINDSPWYSAKNDSETIVYFETLIRRIYEHNPKAEIVLVYCIDDKIDQSLDYFPTAQVQEIIAKHYNIPSINVGKAIVDNMAENKYNWGFYFTDYVHPNDLGYLYYACVISEFLSNSLDPEKCGDSITEKTLPQKHTKKELWYDLTMLEASEVDLSLSKNWALSEDGKKIYPTAEDNELVIKTYGSDICIAAPRSDEMFYSVDGGAEQFMSMNRKPQTLFENLSNTEHTLRIRAKDIKKLSIQRIMYNGIK